MLRKIAHQSVVTLLVSCLLVHPAIGVDFRSPTLQSCTPTITFQEQALSNVVLGTGHPLSSHRCSFSQFFTLWGLFRPRPEAPEGFKFKRFAIAGATLREYIINPHLPLIFFPEAIPKEALKRILDSGEVNVHVYEPQRCKQRLTDSQKLAIGRAFNYLSALPFTNLDWGMHNPDEFFGAFRHLMAINNFSAGTENVNKDKAAELGIQASNAGAPLVQAVDEYVMGVALNAHARVTEIVKSGPFWLIWLGKTFFGWRALSDLELDPQPLSEVIWAQLLSTSLHLKTMFRHGKSNNFIGCGVHPDQTVMHDQLGTNDVAEVRQTIGLIGMKEVGRYLASDAKAFEIHQVLYWVNEAKGEKWLSKDDETKLNLKRASSPKDLLEQSLYVVRTRLALEELPSQENIIDVTRLYASPRNRTTLNTSIRGKTMAILGPGKIGAPLARRAAAFGLKLTAFVKNVHEQTQLSKC